MPPEAPRALAERSEHLIALIEDGATLAAAGRVYGIGRERVRQILEREGISSVNALPDRAERKRLRRLAVDRMLAPAVEAMWRKGMAYDEIAKALEIPIKTVRGLICERVSREERAMGLAAKLRERRTPDEWVVRGLREAARTLGRTPGRAAYDRLRGEGVIAGLSGDAVAYRWGGWAIACELAGLTPNARPPQLGHATYADEDYRAALCRVADALGGPPTQAQYQATRQNGDPSVQAINLRYGGWLSARREVLTERTELGRLARRA